MLLWSSLKDVFRCEGFQEKKQGSAHAHAYAYACPRRRLHYLQPEKAEENAGENRRR